MIGEATAGIRILETTVVKLTPPKPTPTTVAPIRPP